ncbi:hypothetical protein BDZ45DRAFT_744865 [Acephala macrosclerotiorum]|nr:hypothetical protein BDZ45DRAFT_744865 [Acephala macrosclerotiorum]
MAIPIAAIVVHIHFCVPKQENGMRPQPIGRASCSGFCELIVDGPHPPWPSLHLSIIDSTYPIPMVRGPISLILVHTRPHTLDTSTTSTSTSTTTTTTATTTSTPTTTTTSTTTTTTYGILM